MYLTRLFLLTTLLGWYALSPGQSKYFSRLYADNQPVMLFGSVQSLNSSFYVTGITAIRDKAVFAKIDRVGNPVFFNTYIDTINNLYDIFLNSLKRTADGNFIVTGNETDSLQRAFLMKVDSNGNVLLWREYTDSISLIFHGQDIAEVPDSGYLLVVNMDINHVSDVRIIRTDTSGNILSQHDYYSGQVAFPWTIRRMFNGHYMVGAWHGPANGNLPYYAQTWLIEIDSMGNEIRDWLDTDRTNLWPNGMEQTPDSGWIIVRQHVGFAAINDQAYNASILKTDKNFTKQWEIDTGTIDIANTTLADVKILSNGDYILAGGNASNMLTGDSTHGYGWLIKISAAGQFIWQRFYTVDTSLDAFNAFNSVQVLADGGFIACGQKTGSQHLPGQQGWILRTDSNGCLIDECWLTDVKQVNSQQLDVKVYPNPVTNYLTIEIPEVIPNATLQVTDNIGRVIAQQNITSAITQIPFVSQPAGIYFVRVNNGHEVLGVNKVVVMH